MMTASSWFVILALTVSSGGNSSSRRAHALSLSAIPDDRSSTRIPSLAYTANHQLQIQRCGLISRRLPSSLILSSTASSSSSTDLGSSEKKQIPTTTTIDANANSGGLPNQHAQHSAITTAVPAVAVDLFSVDVRYDRRSPLTYDASAGRYLDATQVTDTQKQQQSSSLIKNFSAQDDPNNDTIFQKCYQFLHSAFVPEGVSQSYYRYMKWRILQRFVNANVHVIGTQSLLMGLRGMQKAGAVTTASGAAVKGAAGLGAAAATNWVLKDTLGKVVRMAWASKMGRKFDPDAKRWRFRASLIYALGNGLEVSTYLHPQYFLALAMLANSCKQMSMLTSSATRNALYNSFRRVDPVASSASSLGAAVRNDDVVANNNSTNTGGSRNRGSGGVENIGDITAKGEAQIAFVDLLGIASGICLSRAVGVSVQNVFAVWIVLQIMEIFCMYHEMTSVVYKTFNFERMYTVLGKLLLDEEEGDAGSTAGTNNDKYKFTGHIPTPEQIAATEKIFLPPDHLARRAIAFGSPGRSALDPGELDMLINDVFRGEKYFLVVGQDVKNQRGLSARVRQFMRRQNGGPVIDPQEECHIVLHADANNLDILKSALALVILRKKLVKKISTTEGSSTANNNSESNDTTELRSRECMDVLRESREEASEIFPQLLRELTKQGWRPPLRSMLGRVSARAEWTIQKKQRRVAAEETR